MQSANFTAFSYLAAVLPPLLPLLLVAGALEPHALIRATIAIRASAASGRRRLLMVSSAGRDRVDIKLRGRGSGWPRAAMAVGVIPLGHQVHATLAAAYPGLAAEQVAGCHECRMGKQERTNRAEQRAAPAPYTGSQRVPRVIG